MDKESNSRFSLYYRGEMPEKDDCITARMRVFGFIDDKFSGVFSTAARRAMSDLGVEVPYRNGYDWKNYFKTCPISTFLDLITVFGDVIDEREIEKNGRYYDRFSRADWAERINQIFEEEKLLYICNSKGAIRYKVDEEFENQRSSLIASVDRLSFPSVSLHIKDAFGALTGSRPKTILAIRHHFDAHEDLYKIIFSNNSVLSANSIGKDYIPAVETHKSGSELDAIKQLLNGYKSWINASHIYRHAPGEPEPNPPTIDYAIAHISSGSSYLRLISSFYASGFFEHA